MPAFEKFRYLGLFSTSFCLLSFLIVILNTHNCGSSRCYKYNIQQNIRNCEKKQTWHNYKKISANKKRSTGLKKKLKCIAYDFFKISKRINFSNFFLKTRDDNKQKLATRDKRRKTKLIKWLKLKAPSIVLYDLWMYLKVDSAVKLWMNSESIEEKFPTQTKWKV